ncbi:class I SAM-dependent DNA methyltransferase [Clostridium gasigenes]|uniref:class I SAM-dependent DNA methyltransferase n=1 Tax=Clostridium gasigenes TaxID=94869 RepID=UPI001C0D61D9|nr:class I SAM-dependent methyltransferase [Clostridium gasigenes]MBU3105659.1 class I SAM-dependent methyltransferase [Clostridium gasigenes]MBU3136131.1 class I SAM-dependent methyltransferase [Clostridium gasigenes]
MNFDKVARVWDDELRIERSKIIAKEIKLNLLGKENSVAMEFGAGTGLISFNLCNEFGNITLIDNSEEMIKVVREKVKDIDVNNIKSCCYDLTENSLDEHYDVIYSSMALHHIVDINKITSKFYNMLNSQGRLCIVDLNEEYGSFHKNEVEFDGHNGFSQKWMKEMLEANGFTKIKSYTFYNGKKGIEDNAIEYSLFIMIADKE